MKFKVGDIVTPVPSRYWIEVYDLNRNEGALVIVDCIEKNEIAIVIDTGDSSNLEATVLTQRGTVGRVVSAWLNVLFRSS